MESILGQKFAGKRGLCHKRCTGSSSSNSKKKSVAESVSSDATENTEEREQLMKEKLLQEEEEWKKEYEEKQKLKKEKTTRIKAMLRYSLKRQLAGPGSTGRNPVGQLAGYRASSSKAVSLQLPVMAAVSPRNHASVREVALAGLEKDGAE